MGDHKVLLQRLAMESISDRSGRRTHLVSPQQTIPDSSFELIPDMQELGYAMFSDMISVLFRLCPLQRGSKCEKTL